MFFQVYRVPISPMTAGQVKYGLVLMFVYFAKYYHQLLFCLGYCFSDARIVLNYAS